MNKIFTDCRSLMVVLSLSKLKVVSSSPVRAGVTERSDSRRILTPGSFFYVEM